jgi:4-hydroxy-tetrahydrodipicolinate synthase
MSSNLVPAFHRKLHQATVGGKISVGQKAHYALLPLIEALYTLNHPGSLRDAMALIGYPVGPARSPLQSGSAETMTKAQAALTAIAAVSFD